MYQPRPAPQDPKDLPAYLAAELQSIAQAQADTVDFFQLNPVYVAPKKTRAGQIYYADGTSWNPGSGEGVYRRNKANSAWVFLG